jgi:hypothetical protein
MRVGMTVPDTSTRTRDQALTTLAGVFATLLIEPEEQWTRVVQEQSAAGHLSHCERMGR